MMLQWRVGRGAFNSTTPPDLIFGHAAVQRLTTNSEHKTNQLLLLLQSDRRHEKDRL